MIYNKDAAFSYPVLSNTNNSYRDNEFSFSVTNITDSNDHYQLEFDYDIGSDFVKRLLREEEAVLVFILQSKDNLFFTLEKDQKHLLLKKSRIAFNEKVRAQLHIQSRKEISFSACKELNDFYSSMKEQLSISKNSLIGYSNTSTVRNIGKSGVALFEKNIDPSMKLDFQVQLSTDSIILKFKEEKHLLQTVAANRDIMNIYLYNGLSQAVSRFILENNEDDEDSLFLSEIDDSALNNLDYKIYQLMMNKGYEEINEEMIDEIVQMTAPNIISKFTGAVERLNRDAD